MKNLQFVVPVLLGLEGLVADELRRLNMKDVAAENGRVFCSGTEADIPRLNINLRVGARVLIVLGRFYARTFDELFEQIKVELIDLIASDGHFSQQGLDLLMVVKYLERIGDHATNVAEWVEYSITGVHPSNN